MHSDGKAVKKRARMHTFYTPEKLLFLGNESFSVDSGQGEFSAYGERVMASFYVIQISCIVILKDSTKSRINC